ncbi:Late embryogenesis abundant protein, LEA-14 [Artemisia annua]|uniref:Late embryogenesis abundant protein, LEA-14 n=1 Tax=Artemisia annua TaxID=35608 RepID=A0A2U1MV59_ARTAN|nr:Late embryogenesis abundant protein, LEA-14 [Artemisia annua]
MNLADSSFFIATAFAAGVILATGDVHSAHAIRLHNLQRVITPLAVGCTAPTAKGDLPSNASATTKSETVNKIKADLKTKSGLKLKIVLDSEVRVKVESVKSKKVGIRVNCEGIHSLVPKGKNGTWVAANVSAAKCKIDLRVKIWKWTF